ncbi:MAG: hypothetical protein SFV24_17495 [Gemmatimonadales bacterium]|nr:hypothetical protein [Gemmatimonadales bacterium]
MHDGHEFHAHHRRLDITRFKDTGMKQVDRYAYDLTVVDPQGELRPAGTTSVETSFGWGATVMAPGDGVVIDAENESVDRLPGAPPFDEEAVGTDCRQYLDTFVVIDHRNGGSGEGSPRPVPHLHYQLQDGPDPFRSEGLPSTFTGFHRLRGSRRIAVARGQIDTGDIVEGSGPVR